MKLVIFILAGWTLTGLSLAASVAFPKLAWAIGWITSSAFYELVKPWVKKSFKDMP